MLQSLNERYPTFYLKVSFEYFCKCAFPSFVLVSQKRRSNRQVKRKKYAEELEARLSDDEVKVIVKAKKTNTAASKEPALQLFVVSCSSYTSGTAKISRLIIINFLENYRAEASETIFVKIAEVFAGFQTTTHSLDNYT